MPRSLHTHRLAWFGRFVTPACLLFFTAASPAQTGASFGVPLPAVETSADNPSQGQGNGPVRLRQPSANTAQGTEDRGSLVARTQPVAAEPYVPGEFELFVQTQAGGNPVRRVGVELVTGVGSDERGGDLSPLVPADYVLGPGDEVLVTIWGSVDADLRLVVDRAGRISLPRVGTVQVSGVRQADLAEVVNRRIAQVFRNFQSSVSVGQLRGIRVFVTGFVQRPGAYTVGSLSTLVAAMMRAGGPTAAGSFRNIELRRGVELLGRFDLYDLILKGDRSADLLLQAGDVVHVGPVGPQVGVIGSVNKPGVVELKPGETVADALRMVGGFTAVAERGRVAIERLEDRLGGRVTLLSLPADGAQPLTSGSLLRAFSQVTATLPSQRQNKRVRVDGEVQHPAEYVLPENSSLRDAVRAAGGFTSAAFVYASEVTRESVRRMQQQNYERALSDLETDLARAAGSQRVSSVEEASAQSARSTAGSRLVERLRAVRPNGRIVLQLAPDASELPDLALEDGDRIFVPPRPNAVGVFGSVFNAAAYLYAPGRTIDEYLRLAGGPTKGADEGSIFVVRASGSVVSSRQSAGLFRSSGSIRTLSAEPGDTVFVPEEMDKTTLLQGFKDWTQVLFQFGLGAAGIKSAIQ